MSFDTTGLLEPQKAHAAYLANALLMTGYAWDGSATGTGKTYSACAVIRHLKRKFVVICPKLAIPQWKRVLGEFGLTAEFVTNLEKLGRGNTDYYKRISAKRYRQVHGITDETVEIPLFLQGEWKMSKDWLVVLDESHKSNGVETFSAGQLFNLKDQGYNVLCMSATQATTPLNMRAFGYVFGLHSAEAGDKTSKFQLRKFKEFCEEAGAEYVGKWGAMFFDSSNPESMAKLDKVRNHLYHDQKVAARLTRADMGDIFPETEVVIDACDMGVASKKIQEVYDEMDCELAKLEERCENYKEHILAIITKARRMAEMLKVPTIVEMLADYNAEGRSGVVFLNYTDSIEAVIARLGKEFDPALVGSIYGGQPVKQRLQDIADFQVDKKHFIVANLAAGGQSINLHDVNGGRPRSSLLCPSYLAIATIQAAGRIDRAHAKSDVYQRFLFAAGTIEENVSRRFHHKNRFVTALNDGTLADSDLIPTERLFKILSRVDVDRNV